MPCTTVALALFNLGHPLPAGVDALPALAAPPYWDDWRPRSIGSLESERYPVACHWVREEDEDRCPAILEQIERAWEVQVEEIGFNAPVPDEDGLLDVYLTREGTSGGAYAYGPSIDAVSGDGKMSTAAYIALDFTISDEEMPGYTVHEFNHVLQYATDFTEPTYMIWESLASAAERWTLPEVDVLAEYAKDFQETPWLGVLGDGNFLWDEYGLWSYYEYGGYVWAFHLDETWGDGQGSGGRDLWAFAAQEGEVNEPDVLDAWDELSGDWREALLDLSLARARMGTERAPEWAPWSGRGFQPAVEAELTATALPATVSPTVGPYETGVVYVRVGDLPAGARLQGQVESEAGVEWGWIFSQGAQAERGRGDRFEVEARGEGEALVGIVNFGAPDFDGDDEIEPAALSLALTVEGAGDGGTDGGGTDGGGTDGGGTEKSGCGCASAGASGGATWLLLGTLVGARRRRART